MVLVMKFNVRLNQATVSPAVLCHYLNFGPVFKIFSQEQYPQEFEVISQARYKQDRIYVQELDLQARSIRAMTSMTRVQHHCISVQVRPGTLETSFGPVIISVLDLEIMSRDMHRPPPP